MIDLAARVHYKVHFDVVQNDESIDLFSEVISALSDWLTTKYRGTVSFWNWSQFRRYGDFTTDNHSVNAKTTSFTGQNGSFYWACKIDEFQKPHESLDEDQVTTIEKAPRIWTTEVGFEQETPERATISYVVYYADKAAFVGILDEIPSQNTPRVVKTLLYSGRRFYCEIGNDKMLPVPILIKTGNGNELAGRLLDLQRKTPIILVIPRLPQTGEESKELSFAKELSKNVMGNALVYEAENASFAEELTYLLDKQYWCFPGQIRLYWPITNSSGKRHRYLRAEQIDAIGEDAVIRIFRRVLSQDIRFYESKDMFRISDCDELYRQSRLQQLRSKYDEIRESVTKAQITKDELISQFELSKALFELSETENNELRYRIEVLENDISEAKQECWRLRAHNEHLSCSQENARGIEAALINVRSIADLPRSAYDIGIYFQRVFCESIDFSERGMRSLGSCITKPEILWNCFYAMATTLTDLYRCHTPDIETAFREESGWDMARGEGSQTRCNSDLMSLRKDYYQGREILIEPHVRKGNRDNSPDCVRVYFCYDNSSSKIIIGYVGGHLPNHTSLAM